MKGFQPLQPEILLFKLYKMKILVLGDTHGRTEWKTIDPNKYDKIVFIGDYVDSFNISGNDQLNNLMDIIQFKKDNSDKVVLLFGNHDYHYLVYQTGIAQEYSGFQSVFASQFKFIFNENIKLFQMVYEPYGKIYISHAGISEKWLKFRNIEQDNTMVNVINDYLYYKPIIFQFVGPDPYGDTAHNSPIWIRPNSMNNHGISGTHIVGHTQQDKIKNFEGPKCTVWLIDCMPKEALVIENTKISILKL